MGFAQGTYAQNCFVTLESERPSKFWSTNSHIFRSTFQKLSENWILEATWVKYIWWWEPMNTCIISRSSLIKCLLETSLLILLMALNLNDKLHRYLVNKANPSSPRIDKSENNASKHIFLLMIHTSANSLSRLYLLNAFLYPLLW